MLMFSFMFHKVIGRNRSICLVKSSVRPQHVFNFLSVSSSPTLSVLRHTFTRPIQSQRCRVALRNKPHPVVPRVTARRRAVLQTAAGTLSGESSHSDPSQKGERKPRTRGGPVFQVLEKAVEERMRG